MTGNLGHKALKGTLWASLDRFGVMGLQFVVNIVLARLLTPSDFGVIGVLMVFLLVSQTIIDSGFGSALIQKKETTRLDYSTIFVWNIALSIVLYLVLFFCAPVISRFFRLPILIDVLRVIGLVLIFKALSIVQINRLQKRLAFKSIAITNNVAQIIAGALAIWAAACGWNVWSLVILYAGKELLVDVVVWIISRWQPSLRFSMKTFRTLFNFGGFMLLANILQETCKNFQGIIIGHWFSTQQMGYYTQAQKLDQVTSTSLSQIIVQVMFPVYSSLQDDTVRLNNVLAMNIRVISFIVFPLLGLLILDAEPIITGLYGVKWLPSVPYFRILCTGGVFVCLQNVNFYVVASRGASKPLFMWSIYKWGLLLGLLFIGMRFGMDGIMWAIVISGFNIYATNALLARHYTGFSISRQVASMGPLLLVAVLSLALSYGMMYYLHVHFILASGVFALVYLFMVFACDFKVVADIRDFKRIIKNRSKINIDKHEKN